MKNIKLGDQIYEGVETVRLDTAAGGTVDFAPYQETFAAGRTEGYNAGKEDGIQTEYDRFWDAFQNNGNKTNCNFKYAGFGWTNVTFRPKHIMRPTMAMQMFYYNQVADYIAIFEEYGGGLDTSWCTGFQDMFRYSGATRLPELAIMVPSSTTSAGNMFAECEKLVEIRKIVIGEGVDISFSNAFTNTKSLTTIAFEGAIPRDINFQWSPLSTVSMKSVITHLKNYSGTDKAGTYKVTFSPSCWTNLESDGTTAPDGNTWRDYVETTLGWLT